MIPLFMRNSSTFHSTLWKHCSTTRTICCLVGTLATTIRTIFCHFSPSLTINLFQLSSLYLLHIMTHETLYLAIYFISSQKSVKQHSLRSHIRTDRTIDNRKNQTDNAKHNSCHCHSLCVAPVISLDSHNQTNHPNWQP